MLYDDPQFGFSLSLPDGTPPEMQQQHVANLQQYYAGQQQQVAQQQMLHASLGGLGRVVSDAFAPSPQQVPVISHRAAAAMTPQALQQTIGTMQQGAQFQQQQAQRQQQMEQMNRIDQERMRLQVKQQLTQEKDRSDRLRLQQAHYQNQEKERAFRQKQNEDAEKRRQEEASRKEKMPKIHMPTGTQYSLGDDGWQASPVPGAPSMTAGRSGGGGRGGGGVRAAKETTAPFLAPGERLDWDNRLGRVVIGIDGTKRPLPVADMRRQDPVEGYKQELQAWEAMVTQETQKAIMAAQKRSEWTLDADERKHIADQVRQTYEYTRPQDPQALMAGLHSGYGSAVEPNTPMQYFATPPEAQAPVQIVTDDDYDALPSGAIFIDPQGQRRRKP